MVQQQQQLLVGCCTRQVTLIAAVNTIIASVTAAVAAANYRHRPHWPRMLVAVCHVSCFLESFQETERCRRLSMIIRSVETFAVLCDDMIHVEFI